MKPRHLIFIGIFIAIIILFARQCTTTPTNKLSINKDTLLKVCKGKPKTVIFIWASWCSSAKQIINETYKPLMDSVRNGKAPVNIIMLCANDGNDQQVAALNLENGFRSFYIDEPGNGFPLIDRRHISKFIKHNFTGASKEFSQEINRFGFGVPITIIVDEKLQIIMEHAPQSLPELVHYGSNLK